MSIVVRFAPDNLTIEKYDETIRRLTDEGLWPNPDGLEMHACFGSEPTLRVSEIWESQEKMDAFGEGLRPILTDVGIELSGEPEIFEAHNVVKS
jgi:hypothetical protein